MGRTSAMVEIADTEAIMMTWLSYWTDVDKLQKFATSTAHRFGQRAYGTGHFKHVGIMHETFRAPKGSWESVYLNMPPFGLGTYSCARSISLSVISFYSDFRIVGNTRLPVKTGQDSQKRGDLLREITLASQQTLRQRMRGENMIKSSF